MVLLGGLEFIAAGYLLAEHSKHKKERKRLELQNEHLLNHAVVPYPQPPPQRRRRHSDSDRDHRRPSVAPVREKRRENERHRESEKHRSSEKHREHRESSSDSKRRHETSSRPHKSSASSSRLILPLAVAAERPNLAQQPSRPQPPRSTSQQPRKSRRGSSAPPTPRQELVPYQPTPLHQHYTPIPPPPYPAYNAPSAPPSRTRTSNHSYPPPTPMVASSSRPVPHSGSSAPNGRGESAGHAVPVGHSYVPPHDGAWELPASEVGHARPARAGAMSPHVHFEDGLSTLKEPIEPPPPYREY